ncbi:alpha/beta fold hydrolase [Pseudodesulfovibrio tunisiensis]|uniref:alpha/beta fold hydrolase n=1 Tax=Pseudodesulfovibrio tunisiensis TaxID=463192 RepID=UPI001FB2904C|nr:alpha/beta hydrolase [Pseudodesulfovibrio tunisiensis]
MGVVDIIEHRGPDHAELGVTTTDRARLRVEIRGQGRPLVLLHGWTMSSRFWERQMQGLEKDFCLVAVNFRSHGNSTNTDNGHTMPRYAKDVRDIIDTLDLNGCLLMGWSMGGAAVLEYWNQFGGHRLDGIGLVESAPAPMCSEPWNTHRYRDHNAEAMEADLDAMERSRDTYGRLFVSNMFLSGVAPQQDMEWMLREHLKIPASSAAAIYADYARRDYLDVLPKVSVPALVAYGRSEHLCYGPGAGQFVADSLPNSTLALFDHSGHIPFYEDAEDFNRTVREFAATLD